MSTPQQPFQLKIPPIPPQTPQGNMVPVNDPDVPLTPTLMAQIVNAVKAGNFIETALSYVKITKKTVNQWIELGHERPNSIYGQFLSDMQQAWALAEIRDVEFIDRAIRDGEWKAAVWRLKQKFPHRWGDKPSTVVQSEDVTAHMVTETGHVAKAKYRAKLKTLSVEQLEALHKILTQLRGGKPQQHALPPGDEHSGSNPPPEA